jgi:hypothetical protein
MSHGAANVVKPCDRCRQQMQRWTLSQYHIHLRVSVSAAPARYRVRPLQLLHMEPECLCLCLWLSNKLYACDDMRAFSSLVNDI